MRSDIKNERGSVGGWIITIVIVMIVGVGAFLMLIRFSVVPAPEALASQSWMKSFMPPVEEEPEPVPNEISSEETLRNSYLLERSNLSIAQAKITELETAIASKDALLQEKDDEIASLRNTINLARSQNVGSVALMYEAMDPQDASVFLTNLGAENASIIIAAMRENKAADVLAMMDDTMATEITEIIAGFKNGSVPSPSPAPAPQPTQLPTQPNM